MDRAEEIRNLRRLLQTRKDEIQELTRRIENQEQIIRDH
jgi:hypothetical protein